MRALPVPVLVLGRVPLLLKIVKMNTIYFFSSAQHIAKPLRVRLRSHKNKETQP